MTDLATTIKVWDPFRPEITVYKGPVVLNDDCFVSSWEAKEVELPNDVVIRELLRLDLADTDALYAFVEEFGVPERGKKVPVGAFAADLAILRAMTRFWMASLTATEPGPLVGAWTLEGFECETLDEAQQMFLDGYHDGLQGTFSVKVTAYDDDGNVAWTAGESSFPLVKCLALQLHNLIVIGNAPFECAYERCGNLMVLQRSRTSGPRNRTKGVKYCSPNCVSYARMLRSARRLVADHGY